MVTVFRHPLLSCSVGGVESDSVTIPTLQFLIRVIMVFIVSFNKHQFYDVLLFIQ